MEIVRATVEDAAEILIVQRLAFAREAELYQDWAIPPLTQTVREIEEDLQRATILKAVSEREIVGSIRAAEFGGTVSIGRLSVHPECQRRGIGRLLVEAVEALYPAARAFELFTGAQSEGNIRFYERCGYEITHSKVFSDKVTLVFMRKNRLEDGAAEMA